MAKNQKPAIVLLHGLGGSAEDWRGVAAELEGFQILTPDLPGSAKGPKPKEGYDPASLARWVAGEMTKARVTEAALVGHSLGGRVAGELAAQEPGRVSALVLLSPLGASGYRLTDRLKWKAMSRRSVLTSVPESSMRSAAAYGFRVDGPGKAGWVERTLAARKGPEGAAVARAVEMSVDGVLEAPALGERLKGSKVPLLLVTGAHDPLVPKDETDSLAKARPDASLVTLPNAGHYALLEDSKKVAKLIAEFVRPTSASP